MPPGGRQGPSGGPRVSLDVSLERGSGRRDTQRGLSSGQRVDGPGVQEEGLPGKCAGDRRQERARVLGGLGAGGREGDGRKPSARPRSAQRGAAGAPRGRGPRAGPSLTQGHVSTDAPEHLDPHHQTVLAAQPGPEEDRAGRRL